MECSQGETRSPPNLPKAELHSAQLAYTYATTSASQPAAWSPSAPFVPHCTAPEPVDKVVHHHPQLGVSSSTAHLTRRLAQGIQRRRQGLWQAVGKQASKQ